MLNKRVGESPEERQTLRIHSFFLLEGNESGRLLLEGDEQMGENKLRLSGDAATIGSTITKRVGEI